MRAPIIAEDRDPFVDVFKGAMILWVIHIHTVYWSGYLYVPEAVRQFTLLADVPIFFFISGYLTRPGSAVSMLIKAIRQFVRLYGQYILISCLILAILVLTRIIGAGWGETDLGLALKSMFAIIPHGDLWERIPVYAGSLWFIQDYLSMLIFIPLLLGFTLMFRIRYNALVLILLFTALFPKEYADRTLLFSTFGNVSFYLVFFMLGTIFRDQEEVLEARAVLLSLLITAALGLLVLFMGGGVLEIQKYKFPPSIQYLIYSLLLIHVFVLLKKKLQFKSISYRGSISRFLRWCGVNIFTIYLFQGAVCSLPFLFIDRLKEGLHPVPLYVLILSFNLVFTLLTSYLYRRAADALQGGRVSPAGR
jgi:hypothetical protein